MNKKTILNRTLPLIVALLVIIIVAVCVTVFTGNEKKPMVDKSDETYLTIDLGYDKPIYVTKGELYSKLLNGDTGLTYLVNILDKKLLTENGYISKVAEADVKKAIEEAIFGEDYEFDPENLDADNEKIKSFKQSMYLSYGMEIKDSALEIKDSALSVSLTGEEELKDYYTLVVAREKYTRDQMGEDQKESYEKFIKEYEEYLVELKKFEDEEISTAPTEPTDESVITSSSVKTDFESENKDNYWALVVSYTTKAEAEQALLQVGVVIYNSKWYEYKGFIDLKDSANFDEDGEAYSSLANYYKEEGTELSKWEIQEKLIKLYNNAAGKETLKEGVHYTIDTKTKAEYDALSDDLKAEKYTEIKAEEENGESTYKAVIFNTTAKDDEDATENELFYTGDKLDNLDSSILSYIKSLTALYTDGATWTKCYSNSIQAKGDYYVLAFKFSTVEATDFEDVYGEFYDEDKYEDGVSKDQLDDLKLGYVSYVRDSKGNLTSFDYDGSKYWQKVQELLDDAVTSAKINEYMAKLRYESDLIILDKDIEDKYVSTYTSDYKESKKSDKEIVAKITINGNEFSVSAEDLYVKLEKALGAITAADAYQYHNVLSQSDVIDYGKYLSGEKLDNCVYITEYALAKEGTTTAVTKWLKADSDGIVEFTKVDGTAKYDVLVRKATKGEEKKIEKIDVFEVEIDDDSSAKTTIKVTIDDLAHYHDPETTYNELDEQISALKIYFTNGNFESYGYAASYGWKNFLKDYFASYYGITINNNEDLKLYYLYEDAVSHITEEISLLAQENGQATTEAQKIWNTIYLPYMQKAYDEYFSIDAIHFLVSVNDEEGNISDPNAEDTAWTAEQKAAAEELYALVYKILRKTKSTKQASVLEDIVSAFEAAPKFVIGVEQTTEAQQKYFDENVLYVEKNENGDIIDQAIQYTAEFKGITLEVSKYKTLGLNVKYEDLGTVTAGKMVEPFENALKLMWQTKQVTDAGMQEGTALESNEFYDEYAGEGEYLITEFGYHVLIANKFTGKTTAKIKVDTKDVQKIVTLPSLEDVLIYQADGEEVDNLLDYNISQIETYYSSIAEDFATSYWYQIGVMKSLIEDLQNSSKLTYASSDAKEKAIKIANIYIDTYYESLSYITKDYDYAMDIMEIFVDAYNAKAFAIENGSEDYVANYTISDANLDIILAAAEEAISKNYDMNSTEEKEYLELKAKFEVAKQAWNASK